MTGSRVTRDGVDVPAGRRLRRNSGEITKARLLDVAAELGTFMPYPDITVEHLTEPAGISRATFYLYFRSKTDIYVALTSDTCEALYASVDALLDQDGDAGQRIRRLVQGYLEAFVEHLGPLRLLYGVAPSDDRFDEILRGLSERLVRCVERELGEGQSRGQFRPDLDPALTADALWGMIEGFCHRHLVTAPGISFRGPKLRQSGELLADLIHRSIAMPPTS